LNCVHAGGPSHRNGIAVVVLLAILRAGRRRRRRLRSARLLVFLGASTDKAAPGTDLFVGSFVVDTGYESPTWVAEQCAVKGGCADHP
jgi:MYXO-CTERM domain-containing protein